MAFIGIFHWVQRDWNYLLNIYQIFYTITSFHIIHYKYLLYGHKKSEYFYPCYLFYAAILKIENSRRTHWKRILFMYSISFFLRCINCHGCIHPTPGTSRYIYNFVNIYNIYNKYLYFTADWLLCEQIPSMLYVVCLVPRHQIWQYGYVCWLVTAPCLYQIAIKC